MNTRSFDSLARTMATPQSRRQLLQRLAGGAIGLAAIRAATEGSQAQTCAGIQESCVDAECCFGYGCDENNICIAIAECADFGEGCLTHEQCCGAYFCGETGVCIAAAECADIGQICKIDENCCDGLVCDASGACTAPAPAPSDDSGDSEGGVTTETELPAGGTVVDLPDTGVGGSAHDASRASWMTGVAAAGGAGAALIARSRLRTQRVRRPVPVRIDDRQDDAF